MGKNQSKAKVVTDIKKTRLYIFFGSTVTRKDVERIYTDVRFGVADLKPGFDVVNDLSLARLGHLSGAPTFKKISVYLSDNKVNRVVRVMGKSSILFKQITKLSAAISGYKPENVTTMEEAEKLLEIPTQAPQE